MDLLVSSKDSKSVAITGDIAPLLDVEQLRHSWLGLQERAEGSFFISWGWIGPWLDSIYERADIYIYKAKLDGRLIGLGVLCLNKISIKNVIPSNVLSLNESMRGGCDFWIEYNGLLAERGLELSCWRNFFRALLSSRLEWDELFLSGVEPKVKDIFLLEKYPLRLIVENEWRPWFIKISVDDTDLGSLIKKFSGNTRYQIRRSFRDYEKEGRVELHAAGTVEEALKYFEALGCAHTARWNSVGKAGSFANTSWVKFHRALIAAAFSVGAVQLLRVSCMQRDIGYIYNLCWGDVVYVLQNGLIMEHDNKRKPGFIAHCLAIAYNASRGATVYDFMVGDSQYKRSLAQPGEPLLWLRIQKPRMRFKILAFAERIYRFSRKKINNSYLFSFRHKH